MVMDLNQPVSVSDALVLPPSAGFGYRVVIDLFPTNRSKFDAQAGWPADLKKRESDAERLAALIAAQQSPRARAGRQERSSVLDPGHGGLDSGTVGVNGSDWKKTWRWRKACGCGVSIRRAAIPSGRADKADLFIALHADSNPDSSTTGTSIYTLNDGRSDREASALARRENQSDVIAGVDLGGDNNPVAPILINLAQRDTRNKSSEFAHQRAEGTGAGDRPAGALAAPLGQPGRAGGARCSRRADRAGYLSNSGDAGQMNTDAWRSRVAGAIANAVDAQFGAK